MIVITGAAGFIGSYVASGLASQFELILVDDFSQDQKKNNYKNIPAKYVLERKLAFDELEKMASDIAYFIHLGARTDTAEQNWDLLHELNLTYSQQVWRFCVQHEIPLIYASSAATYGDGQLGFSDDLAGIPALKPLNLYGKSKQDFDMWALAQPESPPSWSGLKFFNVFGPNEYHKGRMASVIFHAFHQIKTHGKLKLFRSHNPAYKDGEQMRDFVYVRDVLQVIQFLIQQPGIKNIFNLGTGKARSFNDLAAATFAAMNLPVQIEYIDTPLDIREAYQYYTQAHMSKLKKAGYTNPFSTLEAGVTSYVQDFLQPKKYF